MITSFAENFAAQATGNNPAGVSDLDSPASMFHTIVEHHDDAALAALVNVINGAGTLPHGWLCIVAGPTILPGAFDPDERAIALLPPGTTMAPLADKLDTLVEGMRLFTFGLGDGWRLGLTQAASPELHLQKLVQLEGMRQAQGYLAQTLHRDHRRIAAMVPTLLQRLTAEEATLKQVADEAGEATSQTNAAASEHQPQLSKRMARVAAARHLLSRLEQNLSSQRSTHFYACYGLVIKLCELLSIDFLELMASQTENKPKMI